MKYLPATLLGLLACCSTVQAEVVIDDFAEASVPTPIPSSTMVVSALNDDITGTRTITTGANSSVTTGAGLLRVFGQLGGFVTMVYDFTTDLDLTVVGNQTLRLDLFRSALGSMNVDIAVASGGGAGTSSIGTFTAPPTGPHVSIQPGDWAGTAVLSAVDQLSLTFTPTTAVAQIESTPNANITATPEPTSMALLGLTGIGGFMVARRRRKKQEESA